MPSSTRRSTGYIDAAYPRYRGNNYFYPISPGVVSTSGSLGNNTFRGGLIQVLSATVLNRVCCEFTVAGDAASVFRIGMYPIDPVLGDIAVGTLPVLDAGTISTGTGDAGNVATGGVPGCYEIVTNVTLQRGWYAFGGAVQGAPTVQPAMRTGTSIFESPPMGTTTPAGGSFPCAFGQFSVPGALPAWAANGATFGAVARCWFKVAT